MADDVLSQTSIDGGGQQIKVNAIAIGACLPSEMSTVEVTVPTLHNPAISIRPISGTTMQLKLTSMNPNADIFYSIANQFPSRQSSEYPGKMVKMGIPKRAGQLRVRARAYLGDLCSGVSELSFDLEGFGLASIERQGEHRFQLQSAGLWISMGDSVKIDSVHQELHDEEMIKAGMAKAGAELPQTQEWLRRQGETLRDDGWSTSPDNPVYRARQQHILETTGASNLQEFAAVIGELEAPPSPTPSHSASDGEPATSTATTTATAADIGAGSQAKYVENSAEATAYDGNLIVGTRKLALFRTLNKLGDDNILDLVELEDAINDADQELVTFVNELGIDLKLTDDTAGWSSSYGHDRAQGCRAAGRPRGATRWRWL